MNGVCAVVGWAGEKAPCFYLEDREGCACLISNQLQNWHPLRLLGWDDKFVCPVGDSVEGNAVSSGRVEDKLPPGTQGRMGCVSW